MLCVLFTFHLKPSAKPLTVLYIASFLVFAGSQVVYMIASKPLCQVGRCCRCLNVMFTLLGRHQTEYWTGRSSQRYWRQDR